MVAVGVVVVVWIFLPDCGDYTRDSQNCTRAPAAGGKDCGSQFGCSVAVSLAVSQYHFRMSTTLEMKRLGVNGQTLQ
ncbi:hypothetical protein K440DRAFT_419159 [Wilcoxina mikolae CBS 423.85]|nr:hypothetical protein K440DRAFT_419159 [Wilcoxina mikolae CBS 423.85]